MGVGDEEEADEISLGLQMQQFLDEWHYRVLHSGLAFHTDRLSCVRTALDLFEMHGLALSPSDKDTYLSMPEPEMIADIVKRMNEVGIGKAFEHFALQLQLVVSATTRVRYALEEVVATNGTAEEASTKSEVARIMDDGDTGISQQILKQAVREATVEVSELNELQSSWWKNMAERVNRLRLCADDAEKAKSQLEAVSAQLSTFGNEQNKKSKSVLMGMVASSDKALLEGSFKSWLGYFIKWQQDKEHHQKFQKQIDDAQRKLLEYKAGNKAGIKGVLMRKAADSDKFVKEEVWRAWIVHVKETKDEKDMEAQLDAARQKLNSFHENQKNNNKKVMMRLAGGKENGLKMMCLQGWAKAIDDLKAENALEAATKKAEEALAQHMAKKSAEAKQVISRMLGSGDQGLLFMIRGAWNELYKADKKELEMDEAVKNAQLKFSQMSARQKRIVKNVAERTNKMELDITVGFVFNQWMTAARVERVHRHYSGKMETKKHQLDAVQSMFKSFATQLEQGISTTPRSQRKSNRSGSHSRGDGSGSAARPPQLPAEQRTALPATDEYRKHPPQPGTDEFDMMDANKDGLVTRPEYDAYKKRKA